MRIEDKLGETMRRATADEPLPRDVWDSFHRRAERSRKVRTATTGLAAAAMIAAAAVIVPALMSNEAPVDTPSTQAPEPAPTADPTAGWTVTANVDHGFALKHPADWQFGSFEGDTSLRSPESDGSLQEGSKYFEVSVNITGDRYDEAKLMSKPGATRGEIDGRRYVKVSGERREQYIIDWTGHVALFAGISSDRDDLWSTYLERGRTIVHTLRETSPTGSSVWGNAMYNYALSLPGDWTYGAFEGADEYRPKGLPSLPQGDPTFAIQIRLHQGSHCRDLDSAACETDARFGGRAYTVSTHADPAGGGRVVYQVDWDGKPPCRSGEVCTYDYRFGRLEVSIIYGSETLKTQHLDTAEKMLRTIRLI